MPLRGRRLSLTTGFTGRQRAPVEAVKERRAAIDSDLKTPHYQAEVKREQEAAKALAKQQKHHKGASRSYGIGD